MVAVFAPVMTCIFMILKQTVFRSATDVMSNYLNLWPRLFFFRLLCCNTFRRLCCDTFKCVYFVYVFICCMPLKWGARIACWLECWTRDWKVVNPGRSGGRIFFPRVKFVCWLSFGVRSISVLLQWHVKDSGDSARSAGGRLYLNMHTSVTQRSRSGPTMPLSRRSVGTYQETNSHATHQGTIGQSSQLAEPTWTDPGLKSGIGARELISTSPAGCNRMYRVFSARV